VVEYWNPRFDLQLCKKQREREKEGRKEEGRKEGERKNYMFRLLMAMGSCDK
jgi:hypothetical protein